jgi:phosphoglycerol transferase MdoB-like AlkP superfamily enzyme
MIKNRVSKLLNLILISIVSLFLLRLVLFINYYNYFEILTFSEILQSFLMGTRVDIISFLTFNSIIILIYFLPFKILSHRIFSKILVYFWFISLLIIIFTITADLIYFQFVFRHFGNELTAMNINDTHIVFDMIKEYKFIFLLYIIVSIILFFIFRNIDNKKVKIIQNSFLKNIILFIIIFILLILGIRGKIEGKPFSITDAFVISKTASGNLALNGFYTIYRSYSHKQKKYTFYKYEKALQNTKSILNNSIFKFNKNSIPLQRSLINNQIKPKHNIVIILLESWSSKYIDSFGHNNFKVTPNFDKLAKQSILFTNFYANGQRSIEGITALLTGVPVLKGFNYLGSGLELSNLSYLGTILKDNSYSTIAMQSSKRGSFRVNNITKLAGFDKYFGAEDMPLIGEEDKDKKPRFGTWDGNMYNLLNKELDNMKEPFLSFSFTSTTHTPFISPGKKWEHYKHNNKNIFGFLNTLKYADDKLGLFINNAKKKPWFDNTIFIFMADHTIGFGDDSGLFQDTNIKVQNRELENMRIPLLIYAPKIFKPSINNTVGSQVDIIPTLVDILGLKGSFSTLSNSLLHPTNNQFAIFNSGQTIGIVNKSGYLKHTLDKKLEQTGNNTLEEKLLSSYQIMQKLLNENKWRNNKDD